MSVETAAGCKRLFVVVPIGVLLFNIHPVSSDDHPLAFRREYALWKTGMNFSSAMDKCAAIGHPVDLRPPYRKSITHQLMPFYSNGYLIKSQRFWVALKRNGSNQPFIWHDGEPLTTNLTLGTYRYTAYSQDDLSNCVAIKYSAAIQSFVVKIVSCLSNCFPFCETQSYREDPCGYVRVGPGQMSFSPNASYNLSEVGNVTSRELCEGICTDWMSTTGEECWVYSYNNESQSCRLVSGGTQPHWMETCDWLAYNNSWESWKRNCFVVRVYDEYDSEIVLGACVLPSSSSVGYLNTASFIDVNPDKSATEIISTSSAAAPEYLPEMTSLSEISLSNPDESMSSAVYELQNSVSHKILPTLKPSFSDTTEMASIESAPWSVTLDSDVPLLGSPSQMLSPSTEITGLSTNRVPKATRFDVTMMDSEVSMQIVSWSDLTPSLTSSGSYFQSATTSNAHSLVFRTSNSENLIEMTSELQITSYSQITESKGYKTPLITIDKYAYLPTSSVYQDESLTSIWNIMPTTTSADNQCWTKCSCYDAEMTNGNDIFMVEILEMLTIDPKNISSRRRQYSSAPDERPLSVVLGWSGVALLLLVVVGILVLDCKLLLRDAMTICVKIKRFAQPR